MAPSGGRTPRQDDQTSPCEGVVPKEGKPKSKVEKRKTYYWCMYHANPLWALHNPDSFPNLWRLSPKYAELEAAHKGGGKGSEPAAAGDMTLQDALAAFRNSDLEAEEE
jgi:hypothetical protein